MKIGSNISSLLAQRRLSEATQSLSSISERLSSGQRINRASDDAAGLSIADGLRVDSRIRTQSIRNINDGISLVNIATGALTELSKVTTRLSELAAQASNGVYSLTQRRALDSEADALTNEFNRIVASTKFNGRQLFDENGIVIQAAVSTYSLDMTDLFSRDVGAGTFSVSQTVSSTNAWRKPLIVDVNGDGNLDIVGTIYSSSAISVQLGNGDGTFNGSATLALPWATSLVVGDFNNDGHMDIIGGRGFGPSAEAALFLGNGNGTFQASTSIAQSQLGTGFFESGDFNNDGNLDFLAHSTTTGQMLIHIGNGNGTFRAAQTYTSPYTGTDQGFGDRAPMDINGDGILDIMAHSGSSLTVMFGNGDGSFGSIVTVASGLGVIGNYVRGDFDGDGIVDVVVGSTTGGNAKFLKGNGDGSFSISQLGFQNNFYIEGAGDFNNDGHLDFNVGTNLYYGNGDGTFSTGSTDGGSGFGDFNNDGVIDFLNGFTTTALTVKLQNTTDSVQIETFNLNTQESALLALTSISGYRDRISQQLGALGASQARLSVGMNNLISERENMLAAESRIRDTDMAQEAAEYIRLKILQEVATNVLKSANLIPEITIKLLNGGL